MNDKSVKKLCIITMIICVIIYIIVVLSDAHNSVIFLEEQITNANYKIEMYEKRRVDLIYNLVDTVESYTEYEGSTLATIIDARADASSGNIEEAQMTLTAVAEEYPELKANELYKQLMDELTEIEDMIVSSRNNYNNKVATYNSYVRSFPNNLHLYLLWYDKIDYEYKEYNAPDDVPQNLFD